MNSIICHNFNFCMDFLDRLIEDVKDEQMASQPSGVVNHPAWTLGHLAIGCQMMCEDLGLEPWLPPDWTELYMEMPAQADLTAYPSKDEITTALFESRQRLLEEVKNQSESVLKQPFPQVMYSELFPTLGHALNYGMNVHTAFHVGQLTSWRRAMKLPIIKEFPEE